MAKKPPQNPFHKILPKVVNLLFIAAALYGLYFGWGLYVAYDLGYRRGLKDGQVLYQRAVDQKLRALGFQKAKAEFIAANQPRADKTWKERLYRHGWANAVDKATENIPK